MSHSRPLKCLGWWGNCPLLAAFPPASWSRDLVEGRPRILIDPLLRRQKDSKVVSTCIIKHKA
ncbi:unnamed protein product, partial [Rangifer tarandus platyrhynchus]